MNVQTIQPDERTRMTPDNTTGGLENVRADDDEEPSLLAVLTLVLWLMTLAIGLLGLWLSHPPPSPPKPQPPPLRAELIDVAIDTDLTQAPPAESSVAAEGPPAAEPVVQPPLPPLPEVAAPSPAIAFAVPVEGPVQIVAARRAAHGAADAPAMQPSPRAQRLSFGQGEGRQPAPEYPSPAVLERQEGIVGIRFAVGEDGQVLHAEVIAPSRWPLLNQAALQAVRARWQFRPGPSRLYEVSIRFRLNPI